MGNWCCFRKTREKTIVILLLGLDNAGKTVAAKGLAGESFETVMPTVGFSLVSLSYKSYTVKVFDLGGGSNIRGIWTHYFVDAHGVIFVVDSSDILRLDEVKMVLEELLSHEKISGKPVLLVANKQDQENALDEIDLIEKLDLEALVNEYQCPTLVESSSITEISNKLKIDPGIKKGYHWLLNYIIRHYSSLNKRVQEDVHHQELLELELREEKMRRLKNIQETEHKRNEAEDVIESYSEYNRKLNVETIIENALTTQSTLLNNSNSDISNRSSDSFPPVYHGNLQDEFLNNRPKSATRMIKENLELDRPKRPSLKSLFTNKTTPAALYGVKLPHSAGERRKQLVEARRYLKSAGDSIFVPMQLPNVINAGPDGDDLSRQLFELNNYVDANVSRTKPNLKKQPSENGVPFKSSNVNKSEICVVDID